MEFTSSSEPISKRLVTLEAPIYLESSQNFWAQAPFDRILEMTGEITGRQKRPLIRLMSGIARALTEAKLKIDEGEVGVEAHPSIIAREVARRFVNTGMGLRSDVGDYSKIGLGFIESLAMYPYSVEYLVEQAPGHYGNMRNDAKTKVLTESYAFWVSKKLDREGRLKMKGIEEIFPQSFVGNGIGDSVVGGKISESRRWKILHASELAK